MGQSPWNSRNLLCQQKELQDLQQLEEELNSSPLAIKTDNNAKYPKIAGKKGFKAIKKSKIPTLFKNFFCFTYSIRNNIPLDLSPLKQQSTYLPIASSFILSRPLSSISLSSLNNQHKIKELPQKKYNYLAVGSIWIPGSDGLGSIIELSDWISDKLSIKTRQRLANELKRSLSMHDKPGYIYVFNLRLSDKITPYSLEKMVIKIGRATNIQRRLSQWPKQCNFIPELIEYFPTDQENVSKPCLISYRIERLIHIELQDKFCCKPQTCASCGISHREWFYIPNFNSWNEVKQIIEKWVLFSFVAYGKT